MVRFYRDTGGTPVPSGPAKIVFAAQGRAGGKALEPDVPEDPAIRAASDSVAVASAGRIRMMLERLGQETARNVMYLLVSKATDAERQAVAEAGGGGAFEETPDADVPGRVLPQDTPAELPVAPVMEPEPVPVPEPLAVRPEPQLQLQPQIQPQQQPRPQLADPPGVRTGIRFR